MRGLVGAAAHRLNSLRCGAAGFLAHGSLLKEPATGEAAGMRAQPERRMPCALECRHRVGKRRVAERSALASNPGAHNTSIEPTSKSLLRKLSAATHVERWASTERRDYTCRIT